MAQRQGVRLLSRSPWVRFRFDSPRALQKLCFLFCFVVVDGGGGGVVVAVFWEVSRFGLAVRR